MVIKENSSKQFDYERLNRDLEALELPTDFELEIVDEIESYWGLYYSGFGFIKCYVANLSYELAFPHILHEVIHHYQHTVQSGFRRKRNVMHDITFREMYADKLNTWTLLYKDWGVIQCGCFSIL